MGNEIADSYEGITFSRCYLLPETSMNRIATAIEGSIKRLVNALIRKDAESDPRPRLERRTDTPA